MLSTLAVAAPAVAVAQEPFTKGDAEFMQGMIHHHAQALVMAAMASTHGASNRLVLLAKKISLSQRDEIGFMRALDAAHGVKFDSLFLTGMIQHHRGAIKMVGDLVNHPPSGQESEIFRFITDVEADQRAEIDVMQQMLYNLPGSTAQ